MSDFLFIKSDWCVACRSMETLLPAIEKRWGIKFTVITDNEKMDVPAFVRLENGKMIGELRLHGYSSEKAVDEWLKVYA